MTSQVKGYPFEVLLPKGLGVDPDRTTGLANTSMNPTAAPLRSAAAGYGQRQTASTL